MRCADAGRRPRWRLVSCVMLLLAACSVPPRTGWEAELRGELADVGERFAAGAEILSGFAPVVPDAELRVGDELLFGVSLENGWRPRTWYLRLQVLELHRGRGLSGRRQTAFERRVRPQPARRRQLREEREAVWAAWRRMTPEQRLRDCARIRIEAFDGQARPLASAETSIRTGVLHEIHAACEAGYRQRGPMRGRVALGDDADLLVLDDDGYDDVMTAAQGAGACQLLFELLKTNPVTRDILFEVIALPTLWSIVSTMRIRTALTVDFFAAEPVAPGVYGTAGRSLWSTPLTLLLNDQPALYAFFIAGPDGAPERAAAGMYGVVGRHPLDASRRVFVQLLASRRGTGPR